MKKLFIKVLTYTVLIIITLEVFVRVFHLHTEVPERFIDEKGVEKSLPGQRGFSVTGNRRQNYSEYSINNFGFNSYREFTPTKDKIEIALVGDSFIEGMHQDYYISIGKKVEGLMENKVEVYEYGYAGYDLANQLYLLHAEKEHFKYVDHIILYLKYENDLKKDTYKPDHDRITLLKSPLFKIRDQFKLLSYASDMGALDPIKNTAIKIINRNKQKKKQNEISQAERDRKYLENFKKLVSTYTFDKTKVSFLLNSATTSKLFLDYCKTHNYQIIDFADPFENATSPPTLIYDMHWNDHGRDIIAKSIANHYLSKKD